MLYVYTISAVYITCDGDVGEVSQLGKNAAAAEKGPKFIPLKPDSISDTDRELGNEWLSLHAFLCC